MAENLDHLFSFAFSEVVVEAERTGGTADVAGPRSRELHIIHRQTLVGNSISFEFTSGTQESCRLALQHIHVNVVCLTLYLEECGFTCQFVLGHNVDFILAFAVPPSADAAPPLFIFETIISETAVSLLQR